MTDPVGLWRPAIPKKPADVRLSGANGSNASSSNAAALRGATQAFGARPVHQLERANTVSQPGARAAAAVAGEHARPIIAPTSNGDKVVEQNAARGRQMNSDNPIAAARDALRSRSQNKTFSPERPMPTRSPSAIAARFASANSSPSRGNIHQTGERISPGRGSIPPLPRRSDSATTTGPSGQLRESPDTFSSYRTTISPAATGASAVHSRRPLNLQQTPSLPPPKTPLNIGEMAAVAAEKSSRSIPSAAPSSTVAKPIPFSRPAPPSRSSTTGLSTGSRPSANSDNVEKAPPFGSRDFARSSPISIRPPPRGKPVVKSPSSIAFASPTDHQNAIKEDGLANAIVASSLASSRAASPTKHDRPPLPLRRSRSHSLLVGRRHEAVPDPAYTPGSMRPMRHTLRKHSKVEDEEADGGIPRRGRRHHFRKHPNKHHEGDRKRWRDKITERERRRYEGVWAANRGLFLSWDSPEALFAGVQQPSAQSDMVVNIVVRDIWERSRLPKDALEEIWDLVAANEEAMALRRDEFVVGLWLIDQRLKGRKLPPRVSQSIWGSVRHIQGVKVSRKPL